MFKAMINDCKSSLISRAKSSYQKIKKERNVNDEKTLLPLINLGAKGRNTSKFHLSEETLE
jgi:hypothetical protein